MFRENVAIDKNQIQALREKMIELSGTDEKELPPFCQGKTQHLETLIINIDSYVQQLRMSKTRAGLPMPEETMSMIEALVTFADEKVNRGTENRVKPL